VYLKLQGGALIFRSAIGVTAAASEPGDVVSGGVFARINENFGATGEDAPQLVKAGDVELVTDVASNVCDLEVEPLATFALIRIVLEDQMIGILIQCISEKKIPAFKPRIEAKSTVGR
jgi:hypothetical protein